MIRRTLLALAVLGLAALAVSGALASAAPGQPAKRVAEFVPGSYIVVYKDSVGSVSRETDQLERRHGFKSRFRYGSAVKGFSAKLSRSQLAGLRADPQVDFVSRNRIVHATATLAEGESAPFGLQRIRAAAPNPSGSANDASTVGVAVIDTGIDLGHPDLDTSATNGTDCIAPGTPAQDDNGHGTHVAGTIAAENDGAGVVGVAPGTRLYAVKVLDAAGNGSWDKIICGINWVAKNAAANNIKVANMSLGGLGSSADNGACGSTSALHQAICNATDSANGGPGVRFAVAAGNDGWAFPHSTLPDVPASYDEVVTVTAATDSDGKPGATGGAPACRTSEVDDRYASFSNYSNNSTDNRHTVAAPGVCIRSTWPRALAPAGGYDTISGTSMASPHVAGTIARCFDVGGCMTADTPEVIIGKIRFTDPAYGFGGDPSQPVSGRFYGYLALAGAPPAPVPGFTLTATPTSRTVKRGQSTSYSISVTPTNGFDSTVNMSVSGLGGGTTASFNPPSFNPNATRTTVMTVSAAAKAVRGTFALKVSATGGGVTRTTNVTLQVTR
jgi:subtilisin family serine protease